MPTDSRPKRAGAPERTVPLSSPKKPDELNDSRSRRAGTAERIASLSSPDKKLNDSRAKRAVARTLESGVGEPVVASKAKRSKPLKKEEEEAASAAIEVVDTDSTDSTDSINSTDAEAPGYLAEIRINASDEVRGSGEDRNGGVEPLPEISAVSSSEHEIGRPLDTSEAAPETTDEIKTPRKIGPDSSEKLDEPETTLESHTSPPKTTSPQGSLRFGLGARVECRISENPVDPWSIGTVVLHQYREPAWSCGTCAPYQVKLDDGRFIFAPQDSDEVIRSAY